MIKGVIKCKQNRFHEVQFMFEWKKQLFWWLTLVLECINKGYFEMTKWCTKNCKIVDICLLTRKKVKDFSFLKGFL